MRLRSIIRNPNLLLLAALLFFVPSLAGLAAVAYADTYVNGGVAWGPDPPYVEHTDLNPLGVNVFLEKEADPANVEKTLQMASDGGFRWVRQVFAWNDIEISAKGDFVDRRGPGPWVDAWAKYDRIVEGCRRHGLEIIARLDSPPNWARIPGDDLEKFRKGPPANYNDYGDFVYNVASRYKGKIKYFQIWNEPNLHGEWGGHPISPKEYTELLKVAHDAARRANPEAVIITAALAPTAAMSVSDLNDVVFLEAMYREGAARYFDILSTMLYGLGQSPEERRTDLKRLNFSRPILLRRVMEANGDAAKPIWISEYAWISLPPDFSGDPTKNIWGASVDEQTQGRWLVEGYERAQSEWPWIGVMCVWHLRQPDPVPGEPANYFAILRDDFSPRPAYDAIRQYAARFPIADVGSYRAGSPAIAYSPAWSAYLQGSAAQGVYTATIRFEGNRLDADMCRGCVEGSLSVDGAPPVRLAGNDAPATVARSTLAGGLGDGPHVATLGLAEGSVPADLQFAGFTVSRDKPLWNAWGFPALYGLAGLFAVASAALGVSGLGRCAGAALNLPMGRYAEGVREMARNGAVVVGMALMLGLYYRANSLPLILGALAGWWLLAFLKPSTGLAAVAFTIPFFWYPKQIGQQRFPIAETLLLLVFTAFLARRAVAYLAPRVSRARLRVPRAPAFRGPDPQAPSTSTRYLTPGTLAYTAAPPDDLVPATWPPRPHLGSLSSATSQVTQVLQVDALVQEGQAGEPEVGSRTRGAGVGPVDEPVPQRGSRFTFHASRLLSRFKTWSREDAFAPPAVALLLVGTFSLLTLADPAYAKDSARAYRWVIVEPVLFYFLLTDIIGSRRGLWRVADFYLASAVGVALLAIGQFVLGTGTLEVEGVSRVLGVYRHPNNLALYLGRALPFAACAGLFLPAGWRKTLYLLAAAPLGIATILTYSRGAWVAVGLSILIAVAVGLRLTSARGPKGLEGLEPSNLPTFRPANPFGLLAWLSGLALAAGLALIALAALPDLPPRIWTLGSGTLRVLLWESSLRMLADHPVFGVGPDQFLNQFQAHYMTDEQRDESFTAHPHNIVLDYWLSLGIMGLFILLWLLWKFFRVAIGQVADLARERRAESALVLGLLAAMLDFLLHGMVDNSYFLMDLALVFWLCCGLLQLTRWNVRTLER
jgi:polysaccharide biosynthesis protein PslG